MDSGLKEVNLLIICLFWACKDASPAKCTLIAMCTLTEEKNKINDHKKKSSQTAELPSLGCETGS